MNDTNTKSNDPVVSSSENRPSNNSLANNKKNPYTVWFVVLSFLAPVVLAYIMFFFGDVKSFSNHGEILNPIVSIVDFKLKNENGEIIAKDELIHKWVIISFVGKDCDERCATRLFDSRQIHISLGKDQDRLRRMFIHLEPAGKELTVLSTKVHPNVMHVNGENSLIVDALGKNIHDGAGITQNEIYIMDPLGNVMMRFTQDQSNKDILTDLKKLLKVSQIG